MAIGTFANKFRRGAQPRPQVPCAYVVHLLADGRVVATTEKPYARNDETSLWVSEQALHKLSGGSCARATTVPIVGKRVFANLIAEVEEIARVDVVRPLPAYKADLA